MENAVRLGISLFSFSDEYYKKTYTVEQCIGKAAELGAEGIEIVAPQMVRGFPCPTDGFVRSVREACERHGVELVSYGAYPDRGARSDRELNAEELFQAALNDLMYAQKFGCKYMRELNLLTPPVLERLIPYAESYGVGVAMELHNPETFASPDIQQYYEVIRKSGSPFVGFVQDFGAYMEHPYKLLIDEALDLGGHADVIRYIVDATWDGVPADEIGRNAEGMGCNDIDRAFLGPLMRKRFKPADYDGFRALLPYTLYFHGKFYYIDENGFDACIPYDKLLPIVRESGFEGFIMSEYEGHYHGPRMPTPEMLRRYLAMERRLLV